MKLIDLSHEIIDGVSTYPGLPGPVISDFLSREASRAKYSGGTEFHIGRIDLVANTGTYLDTPSHRYAEGDDLAAMQLVSMANIEGVVVRVPEGVTDIRPGILDDRELRGKAVLFATRWSRHWGTDEYFSGHPFLTEETAQALSDRGATLVGIDSLNIDAISDGRRPAHSILLAAGIPIVEHLCNLGALPDSGFRFFAVPPKIRGMGTFPVRAFAIATDG